MVSRNLVGNSQSKMHTMISLGHSAVLPTGWEASIPLAHVKVELCAREGEDRKNEG